MESSASTESKTDSDSEEESEFEYTELQPPFQLDLARVPTIRRQTGIICTLGPVSRSVEMIEKLIWAGANIFRLNFSHDSHEQHVETIANIREACSRVVKELNEQRHVGIAVDLNGPEIRTGMIDEDIDLELMEGDILRLSTDKDLMEKGTQEVVYIDYPKIVKAVSTGTKIYIKEAAIVLVVLDVSDDCVICQVEKGGSLGSNKAVTISGVILDLPPVSEKDRADMKFAVENRLDFIFASKVRHPFAIEEMRCMLGQKGKRVQIITKIDTYQVLDHLKNVINKSDGIILDRGSLSFEMPLRKLSMLQKSLIARCNRAGKAIVIGSKVLESMRYKPYPSRAEVADVMSAIIDGADALMISSETALGKYPVEMVKMLNSLCTESEEHVLNRNFYGEMVKSNPSTIDAVRATAVSAVEMSLRRVASCILVLTTTGNTANAVSMFRPRCPILAVTRCSRTARQASLHRSVIPIVCKGRPIPDFLKDVKQRIKFGLTLGKRMGIVETGDPVLVMSPWHKGTGFSNNMRLIHAFCDPPPRGGKKKLQT